MIHNKSPYLIDDDRHHYGYGIEPKTVKVLDARRGEWAGYYRPEWPRLVLIGISFGEPPAEVLPGFEARNQIDTHILENERAWNTLYRAD